MKHFEDNFAHDLLPDLVIQPEYILNLKEFQQPEMLNCVERLLDSHIVAGNGNEICLRSNYSHYFNNNYIKFFMAFISLKNFN